MLKRMLKKDLFSCCLNKRTWARPVHPSTTGPFWTRFSPQNHQLEEREISKAMSSPNKKKDWFLYLMLNDQRLCRLNLNNLCKKKRSLRPVCFELLHSDGDDDKDSADEITIPQGVQPITVGSKVYMIRGFKQSVELDVYSFDPEGPLIRLSDFPISQFLGPRCSFYDSNLVLCTIENKIYALDLGYKEEEAAINYDEPPIFFKVFDPLYQSWKNLPHPPFFNKSPSHIGPYVDHSSWGHKLLVRTWSRDRENSPASPLDTDDDVAPAADSGASYIFDAHEEKWEECPGEEEYECGDLNDILDEGFSAVTEMEGFLIGIPQSCTEQLVAYQLDSNGIPKLHRVLHELDGIFCPFLLGGNYRMGKCDDGRMWLTYCGTGIMDCGGTRVAVFRVSISNDPAGNPVLSAHVEAAEFYDLYEGSDSHCDSAFAMLHHTTKEKSKKEFGHIIPHI